MKRSSHQAEHPSTSQIEAVLATAAKQLGEERFNRRFLLAEWQTVVDAWQIKTWDAYRDVSRLGRRTRIGGKQREVLWSVFERARAVGQQEGDDLGGDPGPRDRPS